MALSPLRAGQMKDRVTIQAPQYQPDGGGGQQLTGWADAAQSWAEVTPISYGDTFKAGLERSTQFYRIRIWYKPWITTAHRVLLAGAALNIRSANDPDRRRIETEIMAESGVPDG